MTAELTPFPRESGNNLQRVFWHDKTHALTVKYFELICFKERKK